MNQPTGVVPPREDYIYRHQKACRGCGKPIYWWETPNGKWSPHDQDGVSHFASCPFQQDFRRRESEKGEHS